MIDCLFLWGIRYCILMKLLIMLGIVCLRLFPGFLGFSHEDEALSMAMSAENLLLKLFGSVLIVFSILMINGRI